MESPESGASVGGSAERFGRFWKATGREAIECNSLPQQPKRGLERYLLRPTLQRWSSMPLDSIREEDERPSSAWAFLSHASGYWWGPESRKAWLWTGAALVLIFANLAV